MAESIDHTNHELANRLAAAADGIVNHAAVGLERDLREASRRLQRLDGAALPVMIPALVSELHKIANTTGDAVTRERLRRLLGEAHT